MQSTFDAVVIECTDMEKTKFLHKLSLQIIILLALPVHIGVSVHASEYKNNAVQEDQELPERQDLVKRTVKSNPPNKVNSQCQYPCTCSNDELGCQAGVGVVKDGCDCCYMCARQQGDLCDYKDKCDEEKGLYCDFQLDGGQRGICRAKDAPPCKVDGNVYKDGEEFKPDCRRLCSCQNGRYACSTLCPQEERRPSAVHCPNARLVAIKGKCCREWTCPAEVDEPERPPEEPYTPATHHTYHPGLSTDGKSADAPAVAHRECKVESTPWSACSKSCDMGVSVRVTNDNVDCLTVEQRRLCLVRPCELQDKHLPGRQCRSTWKSKATYITHGNCKSVLEYRPKYCSTCKRRKCCGPGRDKTVTIEFACPDGQMINEPFMWIKNCECHKEKRCPWG